MHARPRPSLGRPHSGEGGRVAARFPREAGALPQTARYESRRLRYVEVDLAVLRGERQPKLTLFA
jgi:hypothetical protein